MRIESARELSAQGKQRKDLEEGSSLMSVTDVMLMNHFVFGFIG